MKTAKGRPSKSAAAFLQDIGVFPDAGIAERYKRLGWGVRQGQRVKQQLLSNGVIIKELKTTPRGNMRVVRFTDKGRQSLAELANARDAAWNRELSVLTRSGRAKTEGDCAPALTSAGPLPAAISLNTLPGPGQRPLLLDNLRESRGADPCLPVPSRVGDRGSAGEA